MSTRTGGTADLPSTDDDLLDAWRASGWTVRQVWLLYLEVGGGEPLAEVRRRLDGDRDWRGSDELALVVAVNEALRQRGLPALARHPVLDRARCDHGALLTVAR
ncbi:hypothetical protein [Klenkia sp. PcliD-1-E]|uniref:hypothetical protein n=1 Tax=Klenkia sp. PcliD-1-E TaxID=2954492 RepID=UPI0020972DB7|nr:hypothetical protein [Klenkia sp. PcliD-1-E]MCO7218277.1 hypothetical protein [Klenkia sp. PcliD-1-E]